jgi:hypothetical protein
MFKWLQEYSESTSQTKYFTLNAIVYLLAIAITSVYCYARLDFVRSYRTPVVTEAKQKLENSQPVQAGSVKTKTIESK